MPSKNRQIFCSNIYKGNEEELNRRIDNILDKFIYSSQKIYVIPGEYAIKNDEILSCVKAKNLITVFVYNEETKDGHNFDLAGIFLDCNNKDDTSPYYYFIMSKNETISDTYKLFMSKNAAVFIPYIFRELYINDMKDKILCEMYRLGITIFHPNVLEQHVKNIEQIFNQKFENDPMIFNDIITDLINKEKIPKLVNNKNKFENVLRKYVQIILMGFEPLKITHNI